MPTVMRRPELVVCVFAILTGCGGGGGGSGGGGGNPAPPAPPQTFSIGGTVSGLEAMGLVLQNNGGADLEITGDGPFTFPAQLASGTTYSVTIKDQPSIGPLQECSVTDGGGTVTSSAVTNVTVECVSRVFKFLYIVSPTANELRGYSINAADGTLTPLPWPPISTGSGPTIPIPDPAGKFLYLATRGSGIEPPRVAVYAIDSVSGALSEIAESPYDLSTPPPAAGALAVLPPVIHRSGAFGYLGVARPSAGSPQITLYGATIDATTGELTEIPGMPIDLGFGASTFTYDPTGTFAFVPTSATTAGDGEIRSFLVNAPSGVLTPIGAFPTGGNTPIGAFLTPPGGDYLLTPHINSGTLAVFRVESSGTLTPVAAPIPTGTAGSRPIGIVFNRRNNVFYTTNISGGPTTVAAFSLDPATGNVTPVGEAPTNDASNAVALHPSGRFLFQYNSSSQAIQRFSLDQTTGEPTPVPDVTAVPGTTQATMLLDVSGKYLYVTNGAMATLSSYSIDPTTGALTLINTVPTSAGALQTLPFQIQ